MADQALDPGQRAVATGVWEWLPEMLLAGGIGERVAGVGPKGLLYLTLPDGEGTHTDSSGQAFPDLFDPATQDTVAFGILAKRGIHIKVAHRISTAKPRLQHVGYNVVCETADGRLQSSGPWSRPEALVRGLELASEEEK